MRLTGQRHADNLAIDELKAFAFYLRQLQELFDGYQRRGRAHVLIVPSVATGGFWRQLILRSAPAPWGNCRCSRRNNIRLSCRRPLFAENPGKGRPANRLRHTAGSLRWNCWRRSARSRTAYPRRRSRAKWWADRKCADALHARPHYAPCAQFYGWWSRAQ